MYCYTQKDSQIQMFWMRRYHVYKFDRQNDSTRRPLCITPINFNSTSRRKYINIRNNYKAEKIQNEKLQFELAHRRKPKTALMGLAFKPNIDDLRESPAKYIVQKDSIQIELLMASPLQFSYFLFTFYLYLAHIFQKQKLVMPCDCFRPSYFCRPL